MNCQLLLTRVIRPSALITFGAKCLNKSGKPRLKHLAEFAKFLLLIHHSKSYCESIFCTTRKIRTGGHHNPRNDATPGHPSTSVYAETTSIRNNLLEILMPKKSMLACYKWEPTKSILAQAKSATYKNLQARKKQQQQEAAANENPEG